MVEDLGMIACRAMDKAWSLPANESWQAVADAVVAAHEARWWKPIASFGDVQTQGTIGGWLDGEWQIVTGFIFLPYWAGKGYTHVLDKPTHIPAPPKEADHGK